MTNPTTVRSGAGLKRVFGWLMVAALLLLALGVPSSAAAVSNNGTLKIHDEFEPNPVIKNEPHVDCPFHAHFFFADADQTGDWWIQEWSPSGNGTTVWDGSYHTNSNGEYVTGSISLDAGHYKIFWEGSTGNTIKHKAFWVDNDCPPVLAPAPTPTPTPTPVPGASPSPTPVAQKLPDTSVATPAAAESDGYLWQLAFAGFAGLLAAALVLSPVFPLLRKRIRR
jgi:hypothetical protein